MNRWRLKFLTCLMQGITSLKVFTAYNNRLRLPDGDIFKVMRIAREHGLLTMMHAENGDVIDLLMAEALAAGHTSAGMACPHPPGLGRGRSRRCAARPWLPRPAVPRCTSCT